MIVACLTAGCGDSDSFTIEGTVDGNANINLRFVYYANGALVKGLTAAREGKFEYKGVSPNPTIVEILDNDYRVMGRVYISNGDHIECHLIRNAPNDITVSGNDVSERWASFLNKNSSQLASAQANEAIEKYVASNPDDIVSTLLMVTSYNASTDAYRADSVMEMISTNARPAVLVDGFNSLLQRLVDESTVGNLAPITTLNKRDSLIDINPADAPYSLIVLSDKNSGRQDSIVAALKRLNRRSLRKSLQLADIALDRDTTTWRNSVRPDSATWSQVWVAGSLASPGIDRLGVTRLPYFIVTDSSGRQLLRTNSVRRAETFIDSCITDKNTTENYAY